MSLKLTKARLFALSLLSASAIILPLLGSTPSNAQVSSPQTPETESDSPTTDPTTSETESDESSRNGLSQYSPDEAPMLKVGSTGEAVKDLQTFLRNERFYTGAVDGNFGSDLESAVKEFQTSEGLTSDGIVGPETWEVMSNFSNSEESNQSSEMQSPTGDSEDSSGSELP